MIRVRISIELDTVTLEFDKEAMGSIAGYNSVVSAEKAQELLLDGYHKMKKGIESQK